MVKKFKNQFPLFILLFWIINSAVLAQQQETYLAESYLINMGKIPQTRSNALLPYGMLYELLKNYPIEIKWIINSEKKKDGLDFIYKDTEYLSGAFLIPATYLEAEIRAVISKWEQRGVEGIYIEENLEVPVFTSLTIAPSWTLDKQNGAIAVPMFKAAQIPAAAYGGAKSKNWKDPAELGVCDDIFVMPHAEPKFETHKNLYFWNREYKGAIWAGCHAASQLENLYGPVSDKEGAQIIQLNFLSAGYPGVRTSGLIPFHEHRYATPPYAHLLPADPVSQYLGKSDEAYLNGSERIFYPKKANEWRAGIKKLILDPTAPDVPELSNGPGAVLVYGHGFDNPQNGLIMYQASHSIYGNNPYNIAAMRAFFNWSFYAAEIKRKENILKFQNIANEVVTGVKIGDDLVKILNLNPILFELDQFEIKNKASNQLNKIAEFMLEYPELLIDIRSHTDSRANDKYNMELSKKRVMATTKYLINKGVDSVRISGRGYGESELKNNCRNGVPCSEADHQRNRRSEFILSINCELYSGKLKLK